MICKDPVVSCICVTRGRVSKLARAIELYEAQTYESKELVLVVNEEDEQTRSFLARNERGYKVVIAEDSTPLGLLRNKGIECSSGDYFCQWDDDDWYHQDRLKFQLAAVLEYQQDACVLTNWMIYDERSSKAYFSLFRLWEGSILCKREAFDAGIRYPAMSLGEDTVFLNNMISKFNVYPLNNPALYIYVIHGRNSWGAFADHFEDLKSKSQLMETGVSCKIAMIVDGKLSMKESGDYMTSADLRGRLKYFYHNNLNLTGSDLVAYFDGLNTNLAMIG